MNTLPFVNESDVDPCEHCCSSLRSVAYARATALCTYTDSYHRFGQKAALTCYQEEQKERFRRALTHDRICDWARTTKRRVLGITNRPSEHPFANFLKDVYPAYGDGGPPQWTIFLSACEALKDFPEVPHTSRLFLFKHVALQETEFSCTLLCPLPTWTDQVLTRLATFPPQYRLDRDTLLTVLCAHFDHPRTIEGHKKQREEQRKKRVIEARMKRRMNK